MKNKFKVSSMIIKVVEGKWKNEQIDVIKESCENDNKLRKVNLFDSMAVLNALPKDSYDQLETCADLAELFIRQLTSKSFGYDDVRLIFDRYILDSLKSRTREGISNGITSTQYKINDNTIIKDIKLKDLLSNIKTISDLT